jgi:alpha-D-ribose 1-methylphosphonate 5-triphosphate synthase subunit PhnL
MTEPETLGVKQAFSAERFWNSTSATFAFVEKKRINLARGLSFRSMLLLLDKPTPSLDPATTEGMAKLTEAINQKNRGILAIFHHPELFKRLSDRAVRLQAPGLVIPKLC